MTLDFKKIYESSKEDEDYTDYSQPFTYNEDDRKNMEKDSRRDIKYIKRTYFGKNIKVYYANSEYLKNIKEGDIITLDKLCKILKEHCQYFITYFANTSGHKDLNIWEYYKESSDVIMEFEFINSDGQIYDRDN